MKHLEHIANPPGWWGRFKCWLGFHDWDVRSREHRVAICRACSKHDWTRALERRHRR